MLLKDDGPDNEGSKTKMMSEVGFEPTLLSKPELKSGALDHSAILTLINDDIREP